MNILGGRESGTSSGTSSYIFPRYRSLYRTGGPSISAVADAMALLAAAVADARTLIATAVAESWLPGPIQFVRQDIMKMTFAA